MGRPIELILEDTASDPGTAVGNVRRLIQNMRSMLLGGITSAMREAIKTNNKTRKTLYIYLNYMKVKSAHHTYIVPVLPLFNSAQS